MQDDEGNTLKSQDNRTGLRALPLKSMECGGPADSHDAAGLEEVSQHYPQRPGTRPMVPILT
jgi:hypothetical protein